MIPARTTPVSGPVERQRGGATVLEQARSGERISDEDALTLLRSRELVAVGKAADEAGRARPIRAT